MAKKWQINSTKIITDGDKLAETILGIRDYSARAREFFSDADYAKLPDPFLLFGVKKAAERIASAIKNDEAIVIYGDYDIDGITATTLMFDALGSMGAKNLKAFIPDRFEEGYGLNSDSIAKLALEGAQLIISVDCGISSAVEVAAAKKLGVEVIVTDHHTIPDKLPTAAAALVNPRIPGSKYPFTELSGVGVAFTLVRAIQKLEPTLLPDGQEKWLLDLVALGTICDVVPMVEDNWCATRFGLVVLRASRREGVRTLAAVSGLTQSAISASDVGFRLGPRLNAAGRVEHANLALNLLLSKSASEADILASKLNGLNIERQTKTKKIYEQARELASAQNEPAIVLANPDWSHGVVGIVASRIAEEFNKPTFLMQDLGSEIKGSGRSVGEFDLIAAVTEAAPYLERFGGHKFAAGVTLKPENLSKFAEILNTATKKAKLIEPTLQIDALLAPQKWGLELISALEALAPFGSEHVEPVLAATFEILEINLVGEQKTHVRLKLKQNDSVIAGIGFGLATDFESIKPGQNVELAFRLSRNEWQGTSSLQLMIIAVRSV